MNKHKKRYAGYEDLTEGMDDITGNVKRPLEELTLSNTQIG